MVFGFGLKQDLKDLETLRNLHQIFLDFLKEYDIHAIKDDSSSLIEISPYLDDFLAKIFDIESEVAALRNKAKKFDIIYECKRNFVQRLALKKYPLNTISKKEFKTAKLFLSTKLGNNFSNEVFAEEVLGLLGSQNRYEDFLNAASKYASYIASLEEDNILFSIPHKINQDNLLNPHLINKCKKEVRFGFENKSHLELERALSETKYCIYCHKQDKDSCSKGLTEIKSGCPLKQKISEMNHVAARGFYLAALAIIIIDNPMVPATGHRICNDCSKACIFQKQEAVDIPYIESDILQTVLELPWGFEIYALLTRWNPLNIQSNLPAENTNYNILIVGQGPAGFALSHYLLQSGHNVIAIDANKIMPLGFDVNNPIKFWNEYKQNLQNRLPKGFGGVAEYGITPRWDKNNLDIIRIILERNKNFKIYDSVKFGANITQEQATRLGFDHIAICSGAGAPKFLGPNILFKGVKTAAEFLMSLQSGGAFLSGSNMNLLIRLPIAIIGCGLTAIDAAVEALNYYPLQIANFIKKYNADCNFSFTDGICDEFLTHAKLFVDKSPQEIRDIIINDLGGVTIYYHGNLNNSAAYKLNHEEIAHAIAAGVNFRENAELVRINSDQDNYVNEIEFRNFTAKVNTVLVAIGVENSTIQNTKTISYFGDADPKYSGSVVKALASAKYGHNAISIKLKESMPSFQGKYEEITAQLDYLLTSKIKSNKQMNDKIFELVITSPLAAQNFKPGQFFKLQNYAYSASQSIKPLALTGIKLDSVSNDITFIIERKGKSTSLAQNLKIGEKISLTGPHGIGSLLSAAPSGNKQLGSILLIGSGVSNIILASLIPSLKPYYDSIIHLAHYENENEVMYLDMLKKNTNYFIQTFNIQNSIDQIIKDFGTNINNVMCGCSINNSLLIKQKFINTSISFLTNTSMQCMMQGICGQCIISSKNSPNGYIFSCKYFLLDDSVNFLEINNR